MKARHKRLAIIVSGVVGLTVTERISDACGTAVVNVYSSSVTFPALSARITRTSTRPASASGGL